MAKDPLNPEKIPSLKECVLFSREEKVPVGLLVIGGVAMELYGLPRNTDDIDAEITCSPDVYERLVLRLGERGIACNISDDIDHWGMIPLPAGYRERAQTVYSERGFEIRILDPLDFIASKLRRAIAQDIEDALLVAEKFNLSMDKISAHLGKIKLPMSTETFGFKKNVNIFEQQMKERKTTVPEKGKS
jgi:hypothetical protein